MRLLLLGFFHLTTVWITGAKKKLHASASSSEGVVLSLHSLPNKFYTGELDKGSNCYHAYIKMTELCAMSSEKERTWLATLLTNCHLEAASRKTIQWHPEHALRDASPQEFSLVSRYIPLISDICDRTGNAHHLAMFQMKVDNDRKLWANIEELEETVMKAAAVNLDSERLLSKFDDYSDSVLTQGKKLQDLTIHFNAASRELNAENKELRIIQNKIQQSMALFNEERNELVAIVLNFAQETSSKIQSAEETMKLRSTYDELLKKHALLQKRFRLSLEAQNKNEASSKSLWARILSFDCSFSLPGGLWFQFFSGLMWKSFLIPFRVTKGLESLRKSGMLSGQGENFVSTIEVLIKFVGLFVCYRLVKTLKRLVANASLLGDVLDGFLQFMKAVSSQLASLWNMGCPDHQTRRRVTSICEEDKRAQTRELIRVADTILTKRIQDLTSQCKEATRVYAARLDKAIQLGRIQTGEIVEKTHRIEKRQIIIFRKLEKAQEAKQDAVLRKTGTNVKRSQKALKTGRAVRSSQRSGAGET